MFLWLPLIHTVTTLVGGILLATLSLLLPMIVWSVQWRIIQRRERAEDHSINVLKMIMESQKLDRIRRD